KFTVRFLLCYSEKGRFIIGPQSSFATPSLQGTVMKKLLIAAVIASAPLTAMAAGGHGPAGCGLGTEVVFKNANQWWQHVLAATTNGTSGNQTFGMTSGTLGCADANGPLDSGVD